MIIIPKWSQCATCAHFRGRAGAEPNERLHCAAFERIPEEIVMNRFDHSEPYEGDHGIRRKPLTDGERAVQEVPVNQVAKALRARTRTRISLLQKAGFNPAQPRDDRGRWVRMDVIADASVDDRLADDLRSLVTKPGERAKLDAAIEMFRKGSSVDGVDGSWVGAKQLTAESLLPKSQISESEKARRKKEVKAEIATMLAELPDSEAQVEASDRVLEILDNIGWEVEDLASLVGAPDDAYVHVESTYEGLGITVYHDAIKRMYRTIHPANKSIPMNKATESTPMEISNEEFEMAEGMEKKGMGGEIFARQVAAASRHGIKQIVAIAAKDEAHDPPYVGYSVWPKLGYDSPLDEVGKVVRSRVKVKFPEAKNILDVTDTVQGREWWTANGSSFMGTFNLDENSRSMQRLAAYRLRKERIAQESDQWTIQE